MSGYEGACICYMAYVCSARWLCFSYFPERRTCLADYCWYCSCAADSPPAGFIVPAPRPPESEEPSGAWEEAEGSATHDPDACGPGAADAEADTDAGGEDAGADAEAGTSSWLVPFPEPSSPAPTKPVGATRVPPSPPPSKLLTAPTLCNPSRSRERFQPSPPSSTKSAASATSLIPTEEVRGGLLVGESASTDSGALLGSPSVLGYPAALAKARGNPSRVRRKSSMSRAALGYRSSGSLLKSSITRASTASGIEALRLVGESGGSVRCFIAVASAPSAANGTLPVSIS